MGRKRQKETFLSRIGTVYKVPTEHFLFFYSWATHIQVLRTNKRLIFSWLKNSYELF